MCPLPRLHAATLTLAPAFALAAICTLATAAMADPTFDWVAQYDGPHEFAGDTVHDLLVDDAGNAYVTGQSQLTSGRQVATTAKFSAEGSLLWSADYVGPGNGGPEDGVRLALAPDGNIVVAGHQGVDGPTFPGPDIFVAKYTPEGARLWASSYGHDGNGRDWDTVNDLVIDDAGNIYLTGRGDNGSVSADDVQTVSFDGNGAFRWARRYDGAGHWHDEGQALVLDGLGNLYVTGHVAINTLLNTDYVTLKYDLNGNLLWAKTFGAPVGREDKSRAIDVDDTGNVYVSGWYEPSANNRNIATVKYAADGTQLWAIQYATSGADQVNALHVANDGNIVINGTSGLGLSTFGVLTLKYRPDGTTLWTRINPRLEAPSLGNRVLREDDLGDLYVLAFEIADPSDYQYHPIKINGATGAVLWETSFGLGDQLEEYPVGIALGVDRSIYVTGLSFHDAVVSDWDYTVARWTQMDPADVGDEVSPSAGNLQVYPNPAYRDFRLAFSLREAAFVSADLIDASGRTVRSLVKEELPSGPHTLDASLDGLSGGVYWLRVAHGNEVHKTRVAILR